MLHQNKLLYLWEAKALAAHSLRQLNNRKNFSEDYENSLSQGKQTLAELQIDSDATRNRALRIAALFDSVHICLDIARTLRLFEVDSVSDDIGRAKAGLSIDSTFECYPPSSFFNGTLWQLEYAIAAHSQSQSTLPKSFSPEIEEFISVLEKSIASAK